MKFGKLLSRAEELLPDLKRLCLRYKQLKKQLRQLPGNDGASCDDHPSAPGKRELSVQEQDFINMLNEDMKRFNDYFCDKEEEVVIWLQQLDEQLAAAKTLRDKQLCHIGYIHLHGQLVLLYHWSMLNYAALVKILKKHGTLSFVKAWHFFSSAVCWHAHDPALLERRWGRDKTTGLLLKAPFLSNALKQPFSTTGMLSSLMNKCEQKATELNSVTGGLESLLENCPQYEGLFLMKETQAALELWTELRNNASTPSTFVDPSSALAKFAEHGTARKRQKHASSDEDDADCGASGSAPRDGAGASDDGAAAAAPKACGSSGPAEEATPTDDGAGVAAGSSQ